LKGRWLFIGTGNKVKSTFSFLIIFMVFLKISYADPGFEITGTHPVNGYFVCYFPHSKTKQAEGDYQEGRKEGLWSYWYKTGQLMQRGSYKADMAEGPWILYLRSGELESRGSYLNDRKSGFWIIGYGKGIQSKGNYNEDQRVGVWHIGSPDGQKSLGSYVNGNPSGWWTYWYANGKKRFKVNLRSLDKYPYSLMEPGWKYWDEDGQSVDFDSWMPKDVNLNMVGYNKTINCRFYTLYTDTVLLEYIQRNSDPKPVLFFKHHRSIEPILGNQERLVLITDQSCSNCSSVFIYDLQSRRLWGAPGVKAVGFSPDDEKFLVRDQDADMSFYVIDSWTRKVLHEYQRKTVPAEWWVCKEK
jgi:antitoxin component YwqK of YwqJK toxin-antitoxin module